MSTKDIIFGWQIGSQIMNLQMIKKNAPVLTTSYLYGTPSDSGNIGLRFGESVTYYDGIVCHEIPPAPEGHTYTYIFYKLNNGKISARYFSHPLYQKENYIYCERDVGSTLRGSNYDPNTNSWSEPAQWSHSSNSHQEFPDDYRFDFYACLWANTDIVSDDGSMYLPATESIPVNGITGYSYNRTVLPEIPVEIMEYEYIYLYEMVKGKQYIVYGFDTKPNTVLYENFLQSYETVKVDSGTYGSACWYSTIPDEWTGIETNQNVSDVSLGYISNKPNTIIWSNFDIYALDGSLYLSATNPIPVYK